MGSHRLSGPDQLARNQPPLSVLLEGAPAPFPLWLHEPVEKDRFLALWENPDALRARAVSTVGRSKGFDSLPTTFLRSSQISLQSAPRPPQKARAPTVFPVTPRRKRRSIKPNGFTADAGGRIRNASPTAQTRLRQLGRGKGALSNCFSAKNHSPNPVSPKTPKEAGRESKNERRLCLSHRQRSRRSSLPSRAGRLNGPEVGVQRLPAVGLRLERNVRNGDQKTRTVCKAVLGGGGGSLLIRRWRSRQCPRCSASIFCSLGVHWPAWTGRSLFWDFSLEPQSALCCSVKDQGGLSTLCPSASVCLF